MGAGRQLKRKSKMAEYSKREKKNRVTFSICITNEAKKHLDIAAKKNDRTRSAEIESRIIASFEMWGFNNPYYCNLAGPSRPT
jgi:hypothetical protein